MGDVSAEAPFTRSTVTVPREPARAAAARASAAGCRRGSSVGSVSGAEGQASSVLPPRSM